MRLPFFLTAAAATLLSSSTAIYAQAQRDLLAEVRGRVDCGTIYDGDIFAAISQNTGVKPINRYDGSTGTLVGTVAEIPGRSTIYDCMAFTTDGTMWTKMNDRQVYKTDLATNTTSLAVDGELIFTSVADGEFFYTAKFWGGGTEVRTLSAATTDSPRVHSANFDEYMDFFACEGHQFIMSETDESWGRMLLMREPGATELRLIYTAPAGFPHISNFFCGSGKAVWTDHNASETEQRVMAIDLRTKVITHLATFPLRYVSNINWRIGGDYLYGDNIFDLNMNITRLSLSTGEYEPDYLPVAGADSIRVVGTDGQFVYYWAYVDDKRKSFLYRSALLEPKR